MLHYMVFNAINAYKTMPECLRSCDDDEVLYDEVLDELVREV